MGEFKTLRIEQGALAEVPIYEDRQRGKNWAATIAVDSSAPGGIRRKFWPRVKGERYYRVPAELMPHAPIEFGADYVYVDGGGSRSRERWYGIVRGITPESVTLEQFPSAREACEASVDPSPTPAPAAPVDDEPCDSPRDILRARIIELEDELELAREELAKLENERS